MPRYHYFAVVGLMALAAAVAIPAWAGGNGNGNTPTGSQSTITLNGSATYGQQASLTTVDPPVKYPMLASVACNQNGQTVYAEADNLSTNPAHPQFRLWGPSWNGSAPADCTAELYYFTWQGKTITGVVVMATTTFTAAAAS
jgi:hypothetical protein